MARPWIADDLSRMRAREATESQPEQASFEVPTVMIIAIIDAYHRARQRRLSHCLTALKQAPARC